MFSELERRGKGLSYSNLRHYSGNFLVGKLENLSKDFTVVGASSTMGTVREYRSVTVLRKPYYFSKPVLVRMLTGCTEWVYSTDVFHFSYSKSQRDALILKFILAKNSTCFGQIYCPSSGVLIPYSQETVDITSMTNTYCCEYRVETPDDGQ
jgi:hypothetical protein